MDSTSNGIYVFGPFRLETKERLLMRDGQVLTLTPKAFETLLLLIENSGHVLTKEEMMSRLWPDTFVEEANLTNNISILRKALGATDNGHPYIQTVPRVGYRFMASVTRNSGGHEARSVPVESGVEIEGNGRGDRYQFETPATAQEDPSRPEHNDSARVEDSNPRFTAHWRGWPVRAALVPAIVLVLSASLFLLRTRSGGGDATNSTPSVEFSRLTSSSGEEAYPSLSPDGKLLVYTRYSENKGSIYLLRIGGNKPINLTPDSSANNKQPTFSPDGNFIAFASGDSGGIFVMGATGENPKRITEFGANPSWSPDQKQIVFTTDDTWNPTTRRKNPSELWLVSVETGEKHQLPTPGDAVQPNWSPHGYRIAFWSQNAGGSSNVFTMPATGGQPVAVTNEVFLSWNPVWSPDGRYLYFASDRGGTMNLWRVPIDEKSGNVLASPQAVTTPAPHIEHLCFSRDGQHLAYVNDSIVNNIEEIQFDPQRKVVVGDSRWVTRDHTNIVSPEVSPDGEWLVYHTLGEKEDLFVINIDGTGLRQLTNDVSKDRGPRWSPDGKRIAFSSDRSGKFEIWTINADGGQLRQLSSTGGSGVVNPVWSPDGTRLAYTARGGGDTFIAEMEETAGKPPGVIPLPGSSEADFRVVSWSQDGHKLAGWSYQRRGSSSVKDPAHKLCTYSFDTQKFEQFEAEGARAVWLNDNRTLLFVHSPTDTLFLLDTESKRTRKLMSAENGGLEFLSLPRDNRRIFLTVSTYEADIWLMSIK
ncbi:MAG: winged helix-turn-helix domain-containing protein [Pyrinomonadaceae bacterium]